MESTFSDYFTFLPQGGIIQHFKVAGRNIVLGFPSAASYRTENKPHFGETIGRVANRISAAQIDDLNGKSYGLAANSGPNTLHGGLEGWGKKDFDGPTLVQRDGRDAVMFQYLSEDGEEGFPGTVALRLWYSPRLDYDNGIEKTTLGIEYEVELVGDNVDETVVSLTNHSYFNIGNQPTIEGTRATLNTDLYQIKDNNIPTGELGHYPGIEPNEEFVLGSREPAFDHCFIMQADPSSIVLDTRQGPMKKLCHFYHPNTKLYLEVLSTEPAFQFYTGDFINVPAVDGMSARGPRSGMCVEASRYVNAINDKGWRQMVVLKKGQVWILTNATHGPGREVILSTELGQSEIWPYRVVRGIQHIRLRIAGPSDKGRRA